MKRGRAANAAWDSEKSVVRRHGDANILTRVAEGQARFCAMKEFFD